MGTRKEWSENQYAKSNATTKSDVDELVEVFRKEGKKAASDAFRLVAAKRKWGLWEASAVADMVKGFIE